MRMNVIIRDLDKTRMRVTLKPKLNSD